MSLASRAGTSKHPVAIGQNHPSEQGELEEDALLFPALEPPIRTTEVEYIRTPYKELTSLSKVVFD